MHIVPVTVRLSLRKDQSVHQTVCTMSLAKAGARDSGSAMFLGWEAHIEEVGVWE